MPPNAYCDWFIPDNTEVRGGNTEPTTIIHGLKRRKRATEIPFLSFRVFTFGSEQEFLAAFGSLEQAEAEWRAVREEFLDRWDLWGMPSAWWMFEPGIPANLRSGPHAIITEADAEEWDRLEMARRRYLVSRGIDPARPRRHIPFSGD